MISGGGLEGAILEEEERLNGSEVEGEILVEIFKIDGDNKCTDVSLSSCERSRGVQNVLYVSRLPERQVTK